MVNSRLLLLPLAALAIAIGGCGEKNTPTATIPSPIASATSRDLESITQPVSLHVLPNPIAIHNGSPIAVTVSLVDGAGHPIAADHFQVFCGYGNPAPLCARASGPGPTFVVPTNHQNDCIPGAYPYCFNISSSFIVAGYLTPTWAAAWQSVPLTVLP